MKKVQLGLAIIGLGLASSTVFAAPDGTVTVTGKIVDQTCTVGGTSGKYTVVLPTVAKSSLATAATTNGDTKFTINLTACPAGNVGVYYDNTNPNTNTAGRLNNTGSATNVNIQLLNSAKAVIDLSKDSAGQNIVTSNVTSGSASLDFYARYYATGATTAGDVSTTVTYYVVYP
ncbi:fimbrial protein [uncultured Acinetobacter sp.]|uniref:fimbrial protein n=1 Tax=uncultured Acinetobacter sp. TaxID=165433 RepID=UPI0025845C48|nr:fimbrial protein [uncultured Acinetobacter sp.]